MYFTVAYNRYPQQPASCFRQLQKEVLRLLLISQKARKQCSGPQRTARDTHRPGE